MIHYWAMPDDTCLMVYLYAKDEQGELTSEQLRVVARAAREEFG